jgi:hypothetical protein
MFVSSVSATAGMPSRTQASTSALMRMVESTSEYSLCRWRWAKRTVMRTHVVSVGRLAGGRVGGKIDFLGESAAGAVEGLGRGVRVAWVVDARCRRGVRHLLLAPASCRHSSTSSQRRPDGARSAGNARRGERSESPRGGMARLSPCRQTVSPLCEGFRSPAGERVTSAPGNPAGRPRSRGYGPAATPRRIAVATAAPGWHGSGLSVVLRSARCR